MAIGIYILIILALGYASVYLREKYLDLKIIRPLTFLGILIHESAHAIFCLLTGGMVTGFRVTPHEGSITHYRPKVPILGPMLTAIAPMIVGLIAIGVLNHFWLKTSLAIISTNIWENFIKVLTSLNPLSWQGWILAVVLLNIGVMIGPSLEDLKSIWPLVLISFFIHSQSAAMVFSLVIALMLANILLFVLIIVIRVFIASRKKRLEFIA